MKSILIVTNPDMGNPFTRTLAAKAREVCPDVDIKIDLDTFWSDRVKQYDVVHVMFPHELTLNPSFKDNDHLKSRLLQLKKAGVKIVSTCHNFEPHYPKSESEKESYDTVYSVCDMILHLAQYSQSVFEKHYPQAKNVVLYHHTYDNLYSNSTSKAEARKMLGLDDNRKYILSFGVIRSDDERKMLNYLAGNLPDGISLWAPSYYRVNQSRNPIKYAANYLRYLKQKATHGNIRMQSHFVSHHDLPLYFTAADAVLLPRLKILNSGNLPLAFYFGQPVIGPNIGNVGHILRNTGNYTFDPDLLTTLIEAATKAVNDTNKGAENKAYAQTHMASERIARQLVEYYNSL